MSTCFLQIFILIVICNVLCIAEDSEESTSNTKPNILFIVGDDLGFNELGIWGCTDTQTPFTTQLAKEEGLIVAYNYVYKVCSPTRASFLTGRYPSHLGLQNLVFNPQYPFSLTRQVSVLTHELKNAGYSTHAIGKWHLGMQSWEYTPTYRGFDTFNGFYGGLEGYFDHTSQYTPDWTFYDLRVNEDEDVEGVASEQYGVWLERDQAIAILDTVKDAEKPWFMYLAWQASHLPNEAPQEYLDKYVEIDLFPNRIMAQAQTSTLDDGMRSVITYLKENEMWENTLVIFSSDNGGEYARGDNYPLRGYKNTSWEGGVRVPAFVTGGYLQADRRGVIMDEIIVHSVDWYPTILEAVELKPSYHAAQSRRVHGTIYPDTKFDDNGVGRIHLDGESVWTAIQTGKYEKGLSRNYREILLDLNSMYCEFSSCGAIRVGKYKFIRGEGIGIGDTYSDADEWGMAFQTCSVDETLLKCDGSLSVGKTKGCHMLATGCLFDIEADPCETTNLALFKPKILKRIIERLDYWQRRATHPLIKIDTELATVVYTGEDYLYPYQTYAQAQGFERVLTADYLKLYQDYDDDTTSSTPAATSSEDEEDDLMLFHEDRKFKENEIPFANILILLLFAILILFSGCFIFYVYNNKTTKNDYNNMNETTPLVMH